jgi:hypothetical protein
MESLILARLDFALEKGTTNVHERSIQKKKGAS